MSPITTLITTTIFLFSSSHGLQITTNLIHRDSLLLSAETSTNIRAQRSVRSSLARHVYLSDEKAREGVEARLVLAVEHNIFYVNFSIGDPPVPQMAVMDTGSGLTWVKCLPCSPCSGEMTVFDPVKSKSYSPRPCTEGCEKCTDPWWPWSPKHCIYTIDYVGGYTSTGVYATEQLTFPESSSVISNVTFGCSSSLTGTEGLGLHFTGVLALGVKSYRIPPGEKSLVERLGSKFSYCVGSISDRGYAHNRLSFGDGADMEGQSTPFYCAGGNYFVHPVRITLGGLALDIGRQVFQTMSYIDGTIIDTGTELSFIYYEALDVVKKEIMKLASSVLNQVPAPAPFELCYEGDVKKEGTEFPVLGLEFEQGAWLVVGNLGMFLQVEDDVFCFAFVSSRNRSIVGMMAQQGYNVGYDLNARRVYFQKIECELLEG